MNIINYHSLTQFKCTCVCFAERIARSPMMSIPMWLFYLLVNVMCWLLLLLASLIRCLGCIHCTFCAQISCIFCVNVDGLPCRHLNATDRRSSECVCRENDETTTNENERWKMLHKSATDRSGTRNLLRIRASTSDAKKRMKWMDVCWLVECASTSAHTPDQQKSSKTIFPIKHSLKAINYTYK